MNEPTTEATEHPQWHESGCPTCTALDPLLVALNDVDHVDGVERDLIVRLAGGALDEARATAPAGLREALEQISRTAAVSPEHRARRDAFERGRPLGRYEDTSAIRASDRTILIAQLDDIAALVRAALATPGTRT